jgi:hypothetical protein
MRPSTLPRALALHDSGVDRVEYSKQERTVRLKMDLCNYDQPGYQEGDPEIVPGTLTFSDVARVESKPELGSLVWVEDQFDGELLQAEPLVSASPEEDGVALLIHTMDYRTHARDVLELRIFGGDVTWTADA